MGVRYHRTEKGILVAEVTFNLINEERRKNVRKTLIVRAVLTIIAIATAILAKG